MLYKYWHHQQCCNCLSNMVCWTSVCVHGLQGCSTSKRLAHAHTDCCMVPPSAIQRWFCHLPPHVHLREYKHSLQLGAWVICSGCIPNTQNTQCNSLYYAISTFGCYAFHNQASNRLVVDVYIMSTRSTRYWMEYTVCVYLCCSPEASVYFDDPDLGMTNHLTRLLRHLI